MIDDTIRTRALNYTRSNWKQVVSYLIAAVSMLITISVGFGHKQADGAALVGKVEKIDSKMDAIQAQIAQVSIAQAEMRGEMKGVSEGVAEVKNWKDDMLQDLKEGAKTHVQTFSGRRGHKP